MTLYHAITGSCVVVEFYGRYSGHDLATLHAAAGSRRLTSLHAACLSGKLTTRKELIGVDDGDLALDIEKINEAAGNDAWLLLPQRKFSLFGTHQTEPYLQAWQK